MDFDAVLEQVLALVQRQGRVSYRAIKRRFDVEDDYLEDLKEESPWTLGLTCARFSAFSWRSYPRSH